MRLLTMKKGWLRAIGAERPVSSVRTYEGTLGATRQFVYFLQLFCKTAFLLTSTSGTCICAGLMRPSSACLNEDDVLASVMCDNLQVHTMELSHSPLPWGQPRQGPRDGALRERGTPGQANPLSRVSTRARTRAPQPPGPGKSPPLPGPRARPLCTQDLRTDPVTIWPCSP